MTVRDARGQILAGYEHEDARGLPPFAAAVNPVDPLAVVVIRNGIRGYWLVTVALDPMQAQAIAAGINLALDVTAPQREAMQAGSLFGFTCPGSDPAAYDANGNLLPIDDDDDEPAPAHDTPPHLQAKTARP